MAALDFKKESKELYHPPTHPVLVDVPAMRFIAVKGSGDPNTSAEYASVFPALYAIAYTVKMSKTGKEPLRGYFDFVVPPPEGLWWLSGKPFDGTVSGRKDDFTWIMMLRMPDFVTNDVLETVKAIAARKKPDVDLTPVTLMDITEGLCAQVMHIGPYDEEPRTIAVLDAFILANGYQTRMEGLRQHHEIYLGDPRKMQPDKMKTIIRHPVVPAQSPF
ncbi:MAG: GyrI-like domain-containing protein [Eubacteriales bacterium]|nr:GyrI-like domain-containing protein [Eubacteriales bacterium]NLO15461.1 transcriptional regulator [Clostridiales bacterium]